MTLPNLIKNPSFFHQFKSLFDPIGSIQSAGEKYPDIFTVQMIGTNDPLVFVSHPQGLQEIFTNDRKKFAALAKDNQVWKPLLGENSIFVLEGERHKKRRQLLMPSFHGERMRAYGHIMVDVAEKVFNQLPTNQPFSACEAARQISLQVIFQAVFGFYEGRGERCEQLKLGLKKVTNLFRSPFSSSLVMLPILQQDLGPWSPWGKFRRDQQRFDQLLFEEIAERRQQAEPGIDILSLLMSAKDEAGNPMTNQELRDDLITLLIAGYDNAAAAVAWALYLIHQKPEVLEKLLQELDSLGETPDPMSIFKLPYLTAVCNESLRVRPVTLGTFTRVVQEPVEILGYELEPGTSVAGCILLTHQREDLYPNPKEFRPERFLESQFSPFEFMPFGAGARRCLGDALAIFEMKLVLATILERYQLALADNQPEVPRVEGPLIVPGRGVKMVITGKRARQQSPVSMAIN